MGDEVGDATALSGVEGLVDGFGFGVGAGEEGFGGYGEAVYREVRSCDGEGLVDVLLRLEGIDRVIVIEEVFFLPH